MIANRATVLVLLAGVACGCEAIDNFDPFHAVEGDASAADSSTADLSAPLDLARVVDLVAADLALPDLAPPCVSTLNGTGTGDFSIRFNVTTSAAVQQTLMYQRASCDANSAMWDLSMNANGTVSFESAIPYFSLSSAATINNGVSHNVVVGRKSQLLSIAIDGLVSASATCTSSLTTLPALAVASGDPCEGASRKALTGTINSICLTEAAP